MSEEEPSRTEKPITALTVASWFIPLAVAFVVLAITFAMNWEPWFGYAALIAGGIGGLMLAGERLGVRGP